MKVLITGHRIQKLEQYDKEWIINSISELTKKLKEKYGYIQGYSGMASGVDLWFCEACLNINAPYIACYPFVGQENTMDEKSVQYRKYLMARANKVKEVKNSWMVEQCSIGIVVWDGNKGGTHNVIQQLIENKKGFYWINPVCKKIQECFIS